MSEPEELLTGREYNTYHAARRQTTLHQNKRGKWTVYTRYRGELVHIGDYKSRELALEAREQAVTDYIERALR